MAPLQGHYQKWREYYEAKLLHFEWRVTEAAEIYKTIGGDDHGETKLKGWALSDLAAVYQKSQFVLQPDGLQKLIRSVETSNKLLPPDDPKRITNLISMGDAYRRLGKMAEAVRSFEKAATLSQEQGDMYGVASAFSTMMDLYAIQGDWRMMFESRTRGLEAVPPIARLSITYGDLLGNWSVARVYAGRFWEAEQNARDGLALKKELGEIELVGPLRDLGFSLGMQDKFSEAAQYYTEADQNHNQVHHQGDPATLSFWGAILLRRGAYHQAEQYLQQSLELKQALGDPSVFLNSENTLWLGQLHELAHQWPQSMEWYSKCLDYRWAGRRYFEGAALTGLTRVKHAQGDYADIQPLLAEAEQLAQQYEYNDLLASLRLTQAHVAWEGKATAWDNGFEATLHFYQHALIYALRYNRFLLDETLSGRPQGTPLRPIIPYCLERGEEGRKILIALRDWWKTGVNDIGTPRPDTISLIPEGIPLLDAERLAREREPGDKSPQKSVTEQIEAAMG